MSTAGRTAGRLAALILAVVAAAALLPGAAPARANGVPMKVKLAYLADVSNWGPKDAEGVLTISFAEAYARVDVTRLLAQPGFVYEGWLVNPAGQALLVGPVNVDTSGLGAIETKIVGLDRYDYNLFVIAGRAASSAAGTIPAQKSIAGKFAPPQDSPTSQGSSDRSQNRPSELPQTGEKPAGGDGFPFFDNPSLAVAGSLGMSGIAIFAVRYLATRRRTAR